MRVIRDDNIREFREYNEDFDDCNNFALNMTLDEIREFKDKLWWNDFTFIENLIGRTDWRKIFREFRE